VLTMAGSWWRLLAAFLLILVAALLHAQDAGTDRIAPIPANPGLSRYSSSIAVGPTLPSGPSSAGIQSPGPPLGSHPYGPGIGFLKIAHPAGIIFSGTVTAVLPASAKGERATAITFKVNQAIRGASAGQNLTIHEWAGLWSHGERYRVGERVFLFLYSPSRLGLTSPVAGGAGRFAMDLKGRILLSPQHLQIFENDPILGGKIVASYDDFARAVQRLGLE
jgi:hypothetical protein